MSDLLLSIAILTATLSGVPSALASPWRDTGQRIAVVLQVLAAGLGITAAILVLATTDSAGIAFAPNRLMPPLRFGLDALSAVFLLPVCVLCAAAAVFDVGYWPQRLHRHDGRWLRACSGLLFGGLIAVLAARDGVAFLIAWEIMAIAGFLLVITEHHRPGVREAGFVYLAATHAGTLLLFALFCCWQQATGSMQLVPTGALPPHVCDVLFLLALVGFGIKAGIVPLHFWLPPAHATAPSHVSAVMSGVLIKMGVYGVVRTAWLLPNLPPSWGPVLLAIGSVSALVGVAFAIPQHDLKRLLAYHSIENIGIVFLGLGLALIGRARGMPGVAALGLCGALLHVWNHALFKGLLFLASGAAIQRSGSQELDRLGGIARRMPFTAACFLVGSVAICGLPPLNGFVSELLTYLGLFRVSGLTTGAAATMAMLAIPALAMAGAMALLCFAKVFGTVFLGTPRTERAAKAHEVGIALRLPMAVLAAACAAIGMFPGLFMPAFSRLADTWTVGAIGPPLATMAPWPQLSWIAVPLTATVVGLYLLLRRRRPSKPVTGTWDCGFVAVPASVQYTATSFAQQFVDLGRKLLRPETHRPSTAELFPSPAGFGTHVPDLVLDRVLLPALRSIATACNALRLLQRGRVQVYLLYMVVTLILLLLRR